MKSSVKTGCGVRCATAVGGDSAAARSNNATRAHPDRVKFPAVTSPQLRLEFPVLFAAVAEVMQKIASEFKFVEVRRCLSGED